MRHEVHGQVVQLLQAAAAERDLSQRLRGLQQASDLLLHADTPAEVVGLCLEYFTNLQADVQTSLRRYSAYFFGKVIVFKPSLALRCLSTVGALLEDGDGVVKELAAKAAITLHGRAMFLLALESDQSVFQGHAEQLQKVHDVMMQFLQTGSGDHSAMFQLAARWLKAVVLAQTPRPLLLAVRVPAELRGVACLQDFPEKVVSHLDIDGMRQQAEELFSMLCALLEKPPQGAWRLGHLRTLMQCVGSLARQRPSFLGAALACWRRQLEAHADAAEAVAAPLRRLIWAEARVLLSSRVASEGHAEVLELLEATGYSGTLEDLIAQAKYQQICSQLDRERAEREGLSGPRAKRPRRAEPRRLWSASGLGGDGALADETAFDGDALLAGEAETTCRRFEDYFGLPSQREPAGHVPGPALFASRAPSHAELARIALTSLNSLGLKRALLRGRAHERIVAFDEAPVRGPEAEGAAAQAAAATAGGPPANGSGEASGESKDLALFLTAEAGRLEDELPGGADSTRDPRSLLVGRSKSFLAEDPLPELADAASADDAFLLPADAASVRLPGDNSGRDALQLQLFEEVLASQRRMESSPFSNSLSPEQLSSFDQVGRQVALHAATGSRNVNPTLQRAMCKAFMVEAFERLRVALDTAAKGQPPAAEDAVGNEAAAKAALGQLVELFFAKFTTDVSRWQETSSQGSKLAAVAATKTPLREILEGAKGDRRGVFTYAELFEMFIAEFERLQLPKRELRSFLNDIPVVPAQAFKMLEAQCLVAATRKMALLTVLALIDAKPSCRWHCMRLLFWLAYSGGDDSSVRFDTIRLIINKIYNAGPHPPMRWQLPHLSDEEALPQLEDAEGRGLSWDLPDEEFIPLQLLKGRCVEDIATMMLRSIALKTVEFAFPLKVPLRVELLRGDLFKGVVCAPKDRVWPYLALCVKRPVLLHGLVETFTKCDQDMKEHLISSIEESLKYIPASEPELLVLVKKAAPETERLIIKMLHILIQTSQGKETLSKEYGEAVTRLYGITNNPRLLVPAFDLLDRKSLLDFLPAVMMLDNDEVTIAFQQFVRSKNPPLSISELLTELHHMNGPTENIVPIKASMQALNVLFGMREQFDAKIYGIVIQALVEEAGPLPTLFMRTVIQVVKEVPRLTDFIVMQILPRLVRPEVWGDDKMWRGFLLVLQHTFASQSAGAARVLSMLPMSQLEDVLVQHPDWKAHLRDFVARQPAGQVLPHVRQLLQ